jgi:hypothetical protein
VCLNKITKPQCVGGGQGTYKGRRATDDDEVICDISQCLFRVLKHAKARYLMQ